MMERYQYFIYEIPLWVTGIVFFVVLVVPMEFGFRLGLRRYRTDPSAELAARRDVTLQSLLALLGLMLAFTYAFSMSRADMRKRAFVDEVNAMSTAFLRAELAPEQERVQLQEALLEYARTRLVAPGEVRTRAELEAVVARSLEAQARLWPTTRRAISREPDMPAPLKASLVQSINSVLDAHTSRMTVIYDRLPVAVLLMLLFIAAASISMAAYNSSLNGHPNRWSISIFCVVLAAVIFLILDFDIILRGFVRIRHDSLVELIQQMESDLQK